MAAILMNSTEFAQQMEEAGIPRAQADVIAKGLQAGKFVGAIAKICGGGGGGRPNLAQAGGRDASKLPEALSTASSQLQSGLKKTGNIT